MSVTLILAAREIANVIPIQTIVQVTAGDPLETMHTRQGFLAYVQCRKLNGNMIVKYWHFMEKHLSEILTYSLDSATWQNLSLYTKKPKPLNFSWSRADKLKPACSLLYSTANRCLNWWKCLSKHHTARNRIHNLKARLWHFIHYEKQFLPLCSIVSKKQKIHL